MWSSTVVDNHEIVASFIDEKTDGDIFWYTELINRRDNGSNNRYKILRSFEHHNRAHFLEKWPEIKRLCDANNVRAYTRLTPRSYKAVARTMAKNVLARVLDEQYTGLHGTYASACGRTMIKSRKLWFFDVDKEMLSVYDWLIKTTSKLNVFVYSIPSRQGAHVVVKPHHVTYDHSGITLMKNNPTNLYIPAKD